MFEGSGKAPSITQLAKLFEIVVVCIYGTAAGVSAACLLFRLDSTGAASVSTWSDSADSESASTVSTGTDDSEISDEIEPSDSETTTVAFTVEFVGSISSEISESSVPVETVEADSESAESDQVDTEAAPVESSRKRRQAAETPAAVP
jgi:hypothetical protein